MLKMMNINETIAADPDQYVAIAARLALDNEFYAGVKKKTASNRRRIFEDLSAIEALENFFEEAVRSWRFQVVKEKKFLKWESSRGG